VERRREERKSRRGQEKREERGEIRVIAQCKTTNSTKEGRKRAGLEGLQYLSIKGGINIRHHGMFKRFYG
jgi:hypothetical protein